MRKANRSLVVVVLGLVTILGAQGALADRFYNSGGRSDFIDQDGAARAKDSPDLVVPARVPEQFDPAAGTFFLGCFLQAGDPQGVLISGVKARYTAELWLLDLTSGTFTIRQVAKGKTRTGNPGTAFGIELGSADFGNQLPDRYLAIIHTTFRMVNKKTIFTLRAICDSSTRLDP